ncbi:MAG: ABC transporter permease [Thermoprotei archaeon]
MGWGVVFIKDLKELVRNRKALALVTVMPLLLFTALGVLSNYSLTKTPTVITFVDQDLGYGSVNFGQQLYSSIAAYGKSIDLVVVNESSFVTAKQMVVDGQAVMAIYVPQNFSYTLNQTFGVANLTLFTSPGSTKAQVVSQIVDNALSGISEEVTYTRLHKVYGVNASKVLNPITLYVEEYEVRTPFNTTVNTPYASILPALIVLVSVETNVGLIIDSLVGEKERRTLEMLLVTPISRWGLIIGKTLAVLIISLISAIAILVGIILEVGLTFSGLAQSITPTSVQVKPLQAAALIGILTLTVVVTQLITAALSAYATNTKEANASIGLVMSLPVLSMYPLLFSSLFALPKLIQAAMYVLPFTYSYLLLNATLIGPASPFDLVYIAALTAYTLVLLYITVKLYGREAVIVGPTKRARFRKLNPK